MSSSRNNNINNNSIRSSKRNSTTTNESMRSSDPQRTTIHSNGAVKKTANDDEEENVSVLSPSEVLELDDEHEKELQRQKEAEDEERRQRALVVPPLLMHAYHLPGNNWMQDLWQYLSNNHPIVGICCHHPYHPLRAGIRIASLLGSVLFGLVITNIIYLAFVFSQTNYDKQYIELSTNATRTGLYETLDDNVSVLSVTNGNIALWTVGSFLHALYDNTIWALAACTCFLHQEGKAQQEEKLRRYRSTGSFLVILSVIGVTALATFAVALRAALTTDDEGVKTVTGASSLEESSTLAYQQAHQQLLRVQVDGANDYEFIIAYLVELGLTYVIYYPVVGTILFSGILTCFRGRLQVLGGRPYEMMEEERAKRQEEDDIEEGIEVELEEEQRNKPEESTRTSSSERPSF